jgi:tetratricopeptide (TPR) repeat protein
MSRLSAAAVLAAVLATPAAAQRADDFVAAGRALAATRPEAALRWFERALAVDSNHYEANWRAAVAAVETGEETPDSVRSPARDSLYARAVRWGRRAVAADSAGVDGNFALAMALGREALTRGRREQLESAADIHAAATRALRADPRHDGAHHVLGLWNAQVMRTSGFNRFMARNVLGAKVLGEASWARAVEHLERAVELDPTRIYHRLDLARIYADRKRWLDARAQLAVIDSLPDRGRLDPRYREEAAAVRERIAARAAEEERKAEERARAANAPDRRPAPGRPDSGPPA